ncbi:hypothetical protein [Streptomyces purpurascens]
MSSPSGAPEFSSSSNTLVLVSRIRATCRLVVDLFSSAKPMQATTAAAGTGRENLQLSPLPPPPKFVVLPNTMSNVPQQLVADRA